MTPAWKEVSDQAVVQTTPVVSVAMLAYNHAAFIAEAIEGILMQKTEFPIELVIGVDCCPDNTLEIVLRYQKIHPKVIRVLVPEQRLGALQNSLLTLGACRGKYTALCEGDDFWTHPQKLERQVEFLEHSPTVAGSFHDCDILQQSSGQKRLRVGGRRIDPNPDVASLIRENNIATCSMVFRNVIPIGEFEKWLGRTRKGDYMLALLVAQHGPWHYSNDLMSVYRVHDGGIWSGIREVERCNHNVQFWELLEDSNDYAAVAEVIKARRRNDVRGLSIALARDGRLLESARAYLRSLGSKRAMQRKCISSATYFKELAGFLTARLGMQKLAGGILRKMSAHKETRL